MAQEGLGTRRRGKTISWEVGWSEGCFESSGFWEYTVRQVQPSVQRLETDLHWSRSRPAHENLLLYFQEFCEPVIKHHRY